MKMKTPDIEFAAAMMSRGARLAEDQPWERSGPRFLFNLVDVSETAMHEYRTGAATFSISTFVSSRRFLLDVIKTEA